MALTLYSEAYLEHSRTSMVDLPFQNTKKSLLQMLNWVLNAPLL